MNEAIYFKTSLFDVSKERENPFNPIYGLSLLEWLRETLSDQLKISEPDAEDWGWYSTLEYQGNHYLIGSSVFYEKGDDPRAELEWVFQVDKQRTFKEIMFRKNKMNESDACFVFFKDFFEKQPDITDVQIG